MDLRQVRGAGGEPDALRLADQRGEEDEAVGDVLAAVGEVLADEGVVEAEAVGEDDRFAVFLQRDRGLAFRGMHGHGEEAEAHHCGSMFAALTYPAQRSISCAT